MKDIVNQNRVNDKNNNKTKKLHIISTLQKLTRADYLIFDIKKIFNILQNIFI